MGTLLKSGMARLMRDAAMHLRILIWWIAEGPLVLQVGRKEWMMREGKFVAAYFEIIVGCQLPESVLLTHQQLVGVFIVARSLA
ncbi:hypothetical protein U1Q18_048121 [Sarracenia purpurea var. burkii]